jgi:hypothetical protein
MKKTVRETDFRMNHLILQTFRAELGYIEAKLEELQYYRMQLFKLRKFITCNKI